MLHCSLPCSCAERNARSAYCTFPDTYVARRRADTGTTYHTTQSRLASTVLGRLSSAAAASALHRRHLALRGLVGLMRAASAAWEARADAEDHAARYRLWSCLRGWKRAAEDQASRCMTTRRPVGG